MTNRPDVLLIDNYDSFTYNVRQRLGELGVSSLVYRNDRISLDEIGRLNPRSIIISPGPCTPAEAGISCAVVERFGPVIPILGICLGFQCIGVTYGGTLGRAAWPVHGKTSQVTHDGKGIFRSVANPFAAARYHSLIIEREGLPEELVVSAQIDDGTVMAFRHATHPVEGILCHLESYLTPDGHRILWNFIKPNMEYPDGRFGGIPARD